MVAVTPKYEEPSFPAFSRVPTRMALVGATLAEKALNDNLTVRITGFMQVFEDSSRGAIEETRCSITWHGVRWQLAVPCE